MIRQQKSFCYHHQLHCSLLCPTLSIVRQLQTDGRTRCATTSPSTSASSRSRTRAATRRAKAACGPSIQPRWRRCARSCTSGGAKTPSRSAAAWRGQVSPSTPKDAATKRRWRHSDCVFGARFLQNAWIVFWVRDQTSPGTTAAQVCYPEWPPPLALRRRHALQHSPACRACLVPVHRVLTSNPNSPATQPPRPCTSATPLPCTRLAPRQQPSEA